MNDQRPSFGEIFNPHRHYPTGIWIPEGLLTYRGLSDGAKLLFGQLLRHAGENGECFPTKKHLATVLGCDERTIQRHLGELATKHQGYPFIRREQSRPGVSPNDYSFVRHPLLEGVTYLSPPRESRVSPPGSQDRLPEKSNRKSSSRKEKQTSVLRKASAIVEHRNMHHEKGESDSQKRIRATDQPTTPNISKSVDDDEHEAFTRERHPNPEAELHLRLMERHPTADAPYIVAVVKKALMKNGLSMVEYLAEDEKRTTNPKALNRVPGYYIGMVRTIVTDARRATVERLFAVPGGVTSAEEGAKPAQEKCPDCGCQKGRGLRLDGLEITFCECATEEFRTEREAKERERTSRLAESRLAGRQDPISLEAERRVFEGADRSRTNQDSCTPANSPLELRIAAGGFG